MVPYDSQGDPSLHRYHRPAGAHARRKAGAVEARRDALPLAPVSPRRRFRLVDKLVEACRLLDDVYWRQSDLAGLQMLKTTTDATLKRLLIIMGSRWDLLDENRPFAGSQPMPPGHELYPKDLTPRPDRAIRPATSRPTRPASTIPSPSSSGKASASQAFRITRSTSSSSSPWPRLSAMPPALSPDPAFANFLRLRADALLSDDYYKSDLAWLDERDPKIDVIFAPYETYLDDLLGVKTSYGASILIRNEEESRKLAVYEKYVPDIQDALAPARRRPSVQARPPHAHGGDGRALSRRRSAPRLSGRCRQSAQRRPHPPGEGHQENLLQEFHGRPRQLRDPADCPEADAACAGRQSVRRRLSGRHAAARNLTRAGTLVRAPERQADRHSGSHRPRLFRPRGSQGRRGGNVRTASGWSTRARSRRIVSKSITRPT